MKRTFSILMAGLLMVGVMGSLSAFAQDSTQPDKTEKQGGKKATLSVDAVMVHLSETLTLTEEQKAKIKPIIADMIAQTTQAMKDKTLAKEARKEKVKTIQQTALGKIREILTPEQQRKLKKLKLNKIGKEDQKETDKPAGTTGNDGV